MVANCNDCARRTPDERLAMIEAKLDALGLRIDEVVVTQLKDHGKRISALERRQVWVTGWIAGGAAAASGLTALFFKFLGD